MILKLRSYLFLFLVIASAILYCLIPFFSRPFLSELSSYRVTTLWGQFVTALLKHVLGISYKIHGEENIPKTPCVVLSKHQSALDIFVLLKVFDPQTWVLKKELLKIPCFGWALATATPIAIDRNSGRKALNFIIEQGKDKLNRGFWVLIYPEGARTKPGGKGKYENGGTLLAQKAGVDIVPVALNTGLFWQKGKGVVNNGVIDIVVGKPISTSNKKTRAITAEVEAWIEENTLAITIGHPYYLKNK